MVRFHIYADDYSFINCSIPVLPQFSSEAHLLVTSNGASVSIEGYMLSAAINKVMYIFSGFPATSGRYPRCTVN